MADYFNSDIAVILEDAICSKLRSCESNLRALAVKHLKEALSKAHASLSSDGNGNPIMVLSFLFPQYEWCLIPDTVRASLYHSREFSLKVNFMDNMEMVNCIVTSYIKT